MPDEDATPRDRPAWVAPATRTSIPARTEASRNEAAGVVRVPSSTSSPSSAAVSTNLRMFTGRHSADLRVPGPVLLLTCGFSVWSRWLAVAALGRLADSL